MGVASEYKRGSPNSKRGVLKNDPEAKLLSWTSVPKTVWRFLDGNKGRFVVFNTLLFACFFYELMPGFILGKIVDFFSTYKPGTPLDVFYGYVAFLSITYGLVSIVRLSSKNQLSIIGIAVRSRVKVSGFEKLTDASLSWHSEENTGNKVQRILTGSQAFYEVIKISSSSVYPIIATFIGVTLFFFSTSPVLGLFLIGYNIIFFSIQSFFNNRIERLSLSYNQALERSSGTLFEATGNILSIKATGSEKHMQKRVAADEDTAKGFQLAISAQNNYKWRTFQIWNACSFAVFLLLLGNAVVAGSISVGLILVLWTYFNKLREQANDTNDLSTTLISVKADLARLIPLFDQAPPVRTGNKPFPKGWKKISLKDAHFTYPKGERGLRDISFMIDRGEHIGIAGGSGAGKSTLLKIFLGLYELGGGSFKIGSTDFYSIEHSDVAKNVAVVLQETELFNLSFKENITVMREFDADLFERAIMIADLRDVVSRLPEGIDTHIGERGYSLSGGERQRIGIARAIYKNCPIILLDEATSALDSKTEKNIVERLFGELGEEKTFIIVAHRLSTLANADKVIVLADGKIIEEGGFNELLANQESELAKLYALQQHSS